MDIDLANQALSAAHKALANRFFWLQGGTLLGIVRNSRLLDHDHDVDIAMWYKDYEPGIHDDMEDHGFKHYMAYILEDLCRADTYKYNGLKFDIIYWLGDDKKHWAYSYVKRVRQHIVTKHGFRPVIYNGDEYNIPDPPELWLEEAYGKSWQRPTDRWRGRMSPSAKEIKALYGKALHVIC